MPLPDPRPPATLPAGHPLALRIAAVLEANAAGDGGRAEAVLARLVARTLADGEDAGLAALLAEGTGEVGAVLRRTLDAALQGTQADAGGMVARVFLFPVVLVTAGRAPARVAGALHDVGELAALLRSAGALGAVEQFGLGNALGTVEAAAAVPLPELYRLTRAGAHTGGADLLAPAPIDVTVADEQAHLRFVAGAAFTAADAPTFLETAGTVGRWGIPFAQALHRQLAVEGLSLLALPRAPMPWFRALAEGAFVREEVAFGLFATAALRRVRAATGEPDVTVSSRADGSVRVDIVSPFDEQLHHAHAWRLGAADDIRRVEASILGLLRDCRVERIEVRDDILPPQALPAGGDPLPLRH